MKSHLWHSAAAAVAILFVAGQAQAAPQYYNVDNQTLPNGPIEVQGGTITPIAGGVIFSGTAVDLSSQTFNNVKFLSEWIFDPITDLTYTGGGLWQAGDGSNWLMPSPDGFLQASDVSPLPSTWNSIKFPSDPPASVAPTDLLPYLNIGTVAPGPGVPFSETFLENMPDFDYFASFVSTTPVPEPSTFVLLGIAAAGAVVFVRRRNRLTAAA